MKFIMECLFCDIINGKKTGHYIYEDKTHVAFLDKYPIDDGHSLVVPREHHEKITDMSDDKVGELFSKVPKIASAILQVTNADAFSLGQNNGISNDDELSELAQKIRKILE